MASKRFSTISEEDLKALDRDKDSKNTKRVVKHGMNLYNEFLRSNYMDLSDLVENPAELNNQLLSYAFSRTLDESIYAPWLFLCICTSEKRRGTKEKIFGQSEVGNFQASLKHV
ncbi:hypothetical protein DPMN_147789 [Dreissena polymorpha]|uniref:Uncharacterized protein n=1 Tax=Dreissena polymorpha TaxID=45954 RepID=A0A9D4F8W1_DREPO|nr:hypothetical protein DPMN_147789 [Dreissena polymorpha]